MDDGMMYSADTPILGKGTVTAAGIQQFFIDRGKAAAPQFAPNGKYKAPPADIGGIILELSNQYGVNHDMMAAQIGHESAWWQSRIVRDKHNPSGLGATNDAPYENAITFPSPWYGIRATVAHLLSYVQGDASPLRQHSPRHEVLRSVGYLGVASLWRDLNGRWAWPGTTYAQSIASRANDLVNHAKQRGEIIGEPSMSTINGVPFRVSHIPRGNPNRPGHSMTPEWITVHETGNPNNGANAEMHRRFVNNGGGSSNVSWHYTVDDKEIIQHLPLTENGWHAGDGGNGPGNRKSIGIEMCINADGDWGKTMRNTVKLIAHLQDERGFADNRIVQHNHWSGKNCPARMRASNGQGWRDLLTMIPAEREVLVSDGLVLNGKRIIGGFKGRYEALGKLALPTLGLPVTEEFTAQVDGVERTVQLFERGVLGWFPEGKPHGVKPSNPMHVRCLTIDEVGGVWVQAHERGLV